MTPNEMLSMIAQLRRERDEAREVASGLAIQEERVNEALKELSSIHQWIDRNHPDGFIDSLTYLQNLERVTDNWYDRLDRLEVDANRFERERDEARHKLELCMAANSDVARIAKERNEALDQVKELMYIAERAIDLAEIDFENDKFGVVSELRDGVERIKEGAK
jgi:DNA repair ATPase RecN